MSSKEIICVLKLYAAIIKLKSYHQVYSWLYQWQAQMFNLTAGTAECTPILLSC